MILIMVSPIEILPETARFDLLKAFFVDVFKYFSKNTEKEMGQKWRVIIKLGEMNVAFFHLSEK